MRPAANKPDNLTPLLVDAKTASQLCSCGLSLWYSLDSRGGCPQCVTLNSKRVWSYRQLQLWAENNCPSRDSAAWQELLKKIWEKP